MTNHATLALIPDPGEPDQWHVPAPVNGGWLADITAWADTIPGWSWAAALTTLTLFTVISLPWARAQAYKAGRRTAGTTTDTKGRALFIAAMVPAAFFWLAVLAGSFRGLAAFGRDTLHWADGWEYLVPLTLDGIAISFGFLAFRAVRSHRSPDRAVHVATGAAVASALINYAHEVSVGGSWVGGGYLALLSILGLLIFHEFLDQFTEGTAYIQRVNPKFGLRWLTWPSNTVCAWIAWRNYPPLPLPSNPTDGQKRWWGSINHAVAHLNTVRRAKRIARHTVDLNQKRHTIHPLLATIPQSGSSLPPSPPRVRRWRRCPPASTRLPPATRRRSCGLPLRRTGRRPNGSAPTTLSTPRPSPKRRPWKPTVGRRSCAAKWRRR